MIWKLEPAESVEVVLVELVRKHALFYPNLNLRFHTFPDYEKNQAEFLTLGQPDLRKWINDREEERAKDMDQVWILEFQSEASSHWWMAAELLDLLDYVKDLNGV